MILNFQLLNEHAGEKTQLICWILTLLVTEKFQSRFKATLRIQTIKSIWWCIFFQKEREALPNVWISFQIIYWANFDGAPDCVTCQSSETIHFYCDHEEADTSSCKFLLGFPTHQLRTLKSTYVNKSREVDLIWRIHHCNSKPHRCTYLLFWMYFYRIEMPNMKL